MIFNNSSVQGADVSFWQDDNLTPQQINFFKMVEQGASYVIVRAGQNAWVDPDFTYNWQKAKGAGLPRGSYWFYDSRYDPERQAELFAGCFANDPPEMELWLDLEESYGGRYAGSPHWRKFLARLKQLMPSAKIGIYTNYYYIQGKIFVSEYDFYKQFPLWLAWYTDVSRKGDVLIPAPWTSCIFWQWGTPPWGEAWGCESREVDMNLFNGSKDDFNRRYGLSEPIEIYKQIRAYNSDIYILNIDPKVYKFYVSNTHGNLETVSSIARRMGARFATNADMWNKLAPAPHVPDSLAVSNGFTYHAQDFLRPFMNIGRTDIARISFNDYADLYNAASGVRTIVKDGRIPDYMFGTEPQYTERHPRTLAGVTGGNRVVLLVADGRSDVSAGITLLEGSRLLLAEGVVNGLDYDGGGSSAMWVSDRIVNVPRDIDGSHVERAVVNHVMVFNGVEQMANYKAVSLNYNMTLRADHNTGVVGSESVPAGTPMYGDVVWEATEDLYKTINGVATKINQIGDKWMHVTSVGGMVKDSWVAIVHIGRTYCTVDLIEPIPAPEHVLEVFVDGVLEFRKEF